VTSQPNLPPALIAHPRGALILTADGEVEEFSRNEAGQALRQLRPLVCHAPATAARLDLAREFRAKIRGPHSEELRALLNRMRWGPLKGCWVLVVADPGRA
ncbi:hypothetical protein ACI4AF_28405, partial [Klebsiella pneumoniae]|uniref:hypothetical protein n=1 Tax=Klebsiella pneumoniae TaxID=573 RepID=UPI0038544099